MRIEQIALHHVRIPLRKPVKHASHTRHSTDNLLVNVQLSNGDTGWGEGVPREYVTGETIETSSALLRRSDLRPLQMPCTSFEEAVRLAEQMSLAPIPGDDRHCQGNAARCALELAILDAYGRHFNRPVSDATRILAPKVWQFQNRVQYSGVITSARGYKANIAAWAMRLYGFHHLKVKVGIPGYDDASRLRAIRKRVGQKMDIRVDANEAWSPAEALDRMRELEPAGISAVEQPLAHEEAGQLPALRSQIKIPIMLDESLCSMTDAERAIREGLCDIFNLRLSKCGGFTPSLRLAVMAREHGLACQLGCQVGETAILSAAGRHFAASVTGLRYLEGSYDRRLVKEALGKSDITFTRGGWAPALGGGGLGIDVDAGAVERVTIAKEQLLG